MTPETIAFCKHLLEEKKERIDHSFKSRWILIKSYQKSSLLSAFLPQPQNTHANYYKELVTALEMQNRKKVETLLKEIKPLLLYKDDKGNSFMHLLAETTLIEYVQPFLQWGFQLMERNHFGDIPLHYACSRENYIRDPEAKMVKVLLSVGSLFDIPNKQLRTPLMVAAKNGHVEAVKLLMEANADTSVIDQNGQTALQLAQAAGFLSDSPIIKSMISDKNCLIQ